MKNIFGKTIGAAILLGLLFLSSCIKSDEGKDEPEKIYDVPLDDNDYALVPYTNGKAFTMKHNKGFTINFLFDTIFHGSLLYPPVYHYNGDYKTYESKLFVYSGNFPSIDLGVYIAKSYDLTNDYVPIDFTYLQVNVGEQRFQLLNDMREINDSVSLTFDSLYIGGHWRKKVLYSESEYLNNGTAFKANEVWYNAKDGFLKIIYSNQDSLVIE